MPAPPRRRRSRPLEDGRPAEPRPGKAGDTTIAEEPVTGEQDAVGRLEELEQLAWDEEHAAEPWPWGWPDNEDWPGP
jgi:hypothetical protein